MTRFVVDASVAIKWVVEEPETDGALQLWRTSELLAPNLLVAEASNILWKAVGRGELTAEVALLAVDTLLASEITLTPMETLMKRATDLAISFDHPAYDCFYLALAEVEGCPLVTADLRLARKVAARGDVTPLVVSIGEAVTLTGHIS